MTTKRLFFLGFCALLAVVGCHPAPNDVPADGFRLTTQDIVTDADMRVAQLSVVSSAAVTMTVDAELSHMSVLMTGSRESASARGTLTLAADRIAPSGQPWAYLHTLIHVQTTNGVSTGGPAFEALPIATQLTNFFTVTAQSGDYLFDTPVQIGTLRGKPVTITLKRSTN